MTDQFELVEETSEFSALDNVIRGKQGPPGIDGKSAYQVAVEEGFEGTEAEWLESIRGDPGKSAYEAAVDGGFTGTEAEFNTELADFNSAVDGAEAAAEAAENAQAAAETAVSHYPTIIDKNWYVWDATAGRYVDTHVVAEGLNGPQGPTGPQGPVGPGVPAGGTDGDVLVKNGVADYSARWEKPQYSRPNLLDNWYFVGGGSQLGDGVFPINQRGQTVYTTSQAFTIDRWVGRFASGASLTLTGNGIVLAGPSGIRQIIQSIKDKDSLKGRTITITIKVAELEGSAAITLGDATVNYGIGTIIDQLYFDSPGLWSLTTVVPDTLTGNYLNLVIGLSGATSMTVEAVKLEIGSYQTLAHEENGDWVLNELPDYGQELTKCQRYLRIYHNNSSATRCIGIAIAYSTSRLGLSIPGSFAATPTFSGNLSVYKVEDGSSGAVPISAFYIWTKDDLGLYVRLTVESGYTLTSNSLYLAVVPAGNTATFIISCEQ